VRLAAPIRTNKSPTTQRHIACKLLSDCERRPNLFCERRPNLFSECAAGGAYQLQQSCTWKATLETRQASSEGSEDQKISKGITGEPLENYLQAGGAYQLQQSCTWKKATLEARQASSEGSEDQKISKGITGEQLENYLQDWQVTTRKRGKSR
jgi:hypothetical protein